MARDKAFQEFLDNIHKFSMSPGERSARMFIGDYYRTGIIWCPNRQHIIECVPYRRRPNRPSVGAADSSHAVIVKKSTLWQRLVLWFRYKFGH